MGVFLFENIVFFYESSPIGEKSHPFLRNHGLGRVLCPEGCQSDLVGAFAEV